MEDKVEREEVEQIGDLLQRHDVNFVVIGGAAEMLHGGSRNTFDIDICYQRSPANIRHLAAALQELKPTLRGAPDDLPFKLDAKTIEMGSNFTFNTPLLPLDILGHVEPLGGYEEVRKNAVLYRSHGVNLWTISAKDLLRIKLHINRPKDQESIAQLRAIIKIQEERGLTSP